MNTFKNGCREVLNIRENKFNRYLDVLNTNVLNIRENTFYNTHYRISYNDIVIHIEDNILFDGTGFA